MGVKVNALLVPVIHNVDVHCHTDADSVRDALAQQAARPVRWVETVRKMAKDDVTHVVEIGPGKVLQGLVKRIAPDLQSLAVFDHDSMTKALEVLA